MYIGDLDEEIEKVGMAADVRKFLSMQVRKTRSF
jgi:hypothetical protein